MSSNEVVVKDASMAEYQYVRAVVARKFYAEVCRYAELAEYESRGGGEVEDVYHEAMKRVMKEWKASE